MFKNIKDIFLKSLNSFSLDSDNKMAIRVMYSIWIFGFITPLIVLCATKDASATHISVLLTFSSLSILFILLSKFFNIGLKKLSVMSVILLNIGLCTILLDFPFFFASTAYWLYVALILTVIIAGVKIGFITMISFVFITIINHSLKLEYGLKLKPGLSVEQWADMALVDKTLTLITFYIFLYLLIISKTSVYNSLKNIQKNMIQNSALSELGKVAANIAHEINNPLTVIRGSSSYILKELSKDNPNIELIKERFVRIHSNSGRIEKIINGMKNLARDGANDPFERVQLEKVVNEVNSFFIDHFSRKDIDFSITKPESTLLVNARFTQISQIFVNLINNAADAIENNSTQWIKVEIAELDDFVKIMFIDSGKGIDKDIEDKVMQPLFTTKEVGKGTGLGLSIVSAIAKEHGGDFIIDRSFNDSRMTLTLPKLQG